MTQQPKKKASYRGYAEAFQDLSVVEAYRYRVPYPAEIFDILVGLISSEPRRVLDVGCGPGNIARNLVERVDQLDAVDFSRNMLEQGKRLPNGEHAHLRWIYGRAEEVALDPPYALITAGRSLHWMDWSIVMPRFQQLLVPGGYLAMVGEYTTPDPWSMLSEILPRYRSDKLHAQQHSPQEQELFQKIAEQQTAPLLFEQSIDEYIESYHSRSGFSRERMGTEQAAAFAQEARAILLRSYPDGKIPLQITGSVVWGLPQGA